MTVVVFVGPTLDAAEAMRELDATYLPPARQGDVYRVARRRPRAIGIIDGYFDSVPSVWHKEILWALAQGIYVFGAASMGALRAVELAPFGMVGVGEVFAAYHRNELEDDDEVAIMHGPADSGYRAMSEAMVNIRATLRAAIDARVLTSAAGDALADLAKRLPYRLRTYRRILGDAHRSGLDPGGLAALEEWLPSGAVNRKRLDAIGLLRVLKGFVHADAPPHLPNFTFEHTSLWEAARADAHSPDDGGAPSGDEAVLDELRLAGEFPLLSRVALAGVLAANQAHGRALARDAVAFGRAVAQFRIEHAQYTEAEFDAWKASQSVSEPHDTARIFGSQAAVNAARVRYATEVRLAVVDELRLAGRYGAYRVRAEKKNAALSRSHISQPTLVDAGIDDMDLWHWYFERVLSVQVPKDVESHAREHGFPDVVSFRRAVLREFVFRKA